jgi:uncharacterized protein
LHRICVAFVLVAFLFRCATPAQAQSAAPATQPNLDAYTGEFADPAQGTPSYSFYVENGQLIMESPRLVPTVLRPASATVFNIAGVNATATFTLDDSGRASAVALSEDPNLLYSRTGPPVHHIFHDYVRSEAMIPMRDGVKLHAVILTPSDIHVPLPILMQRTPYGVDGTTRAWFFFARPELARAGYIYVGEDIRGRFKSEGKFVMMRPLADHRNPKAVDESTDAYDTVAWLVRNIPNNNGRVGVVGTSYPGFLAMMAGIDPHPAVKAISPQAPMIDVWLGDDFFHNGAFRQSYGYDYVFGMESSKQTSKVSYGNNANGQSVDGFDYFLSRGSFLADVKQSGSKLLPTWKLFLDHPAYDDTWRSRGVEYALNSVAVPTLTVGGYYDQEDMWGPQEEYAKLQRFQGCCVAKPSSSSRRDQQGAGDLAQNSPERVNPGIALEPHNKEHDNFLVLGPWRHGYWSSWSRHLGNLDFGQPIGTEFREQIEAKFFAHFLKDEPGFDLENTASFQTGSNTWKYYAQFPPLASHSTALHLAGGGLLSWQSSTVPAATSYVSDPAQPVPYRHRPIQPTYSEGSQWYNWLTEDQRFVTDRSDVAVWRLPVLRRDLTLTGEVVADIFASTTGTDSDLVVKLIDQYPADDPDPAMRGYQLLTNAEIFRGRYLSGFDTPTALAPGKVYEYKFSLHDVDHVFKAGHTVMVEIQSTWFPLYDRNPQNFVPNIMRAGPSDYHSATIAVLSGPDHDSAIEVPIIGAP